jgi:hypothetical protein
MATASEFRAQIREHMKVVGPDGQTIGMVDRVEGEKIKLTKSSSGSSEHRFLDLSDVAQVRGDEVHMAHADHAAHADKGTRGAQSSHGAHSGHPKDRM